MRYTKYQNSRDLSWQILKTEKITTLPIDIVALCKKMKIEVKALDSQAQSDGYSTIIGKRAYIFVKIKQPYSRVRFTIAHELGHILLGHVGKHELVNREPSDADNPIEQEANVFASRLLAPACVLWGCGVQSPEDVMKLCDISYTAACYRMERMQILYKRNMFLTSPLERDVYKQFQPFITKYQHRVNF